MCWSAIPTTPLQRKKPMLVANCCMVSFLFWEKILHWPLLVAEGGCEMEFQHTQSDMQKRRTEDRTVQWPWLMITLYNFHNILIHLKSYSKLNSTLNLFEHRTSELFWRRGEWHPFEGEQFEESGLRDWRPGLWTDEVHGSLQVLKRAM